jgi:uncharacterized repeat protein (TIGR01451 family)
MKHKVGLLCLVLALLIQLVQGSAGPLSSATTVLSASSILSAAAPPALGLADLAVAAAPENASPYVLPPHYLFAASERTGGRPLAPGGSLPSLAQDADDSYVLMQLSGAEGCPNRHTYYVPFDDRDLWALFEGKAACHNENHRPCAPLVSKVFVTAGADGTDYFYDHHEDGYDDTPWLPDSGSTESGALDAGASVVFASDIYPDQIGEGPLYYDGRDRITICGADANVVRLANPSSYSQTGRCPGRPTTGGWLAAAWEVLEVADWGTEYHATVGEDLDYRIQADDHGYAGLEVMASEDGTTVYYADRPPEILNAGETYFVEGDPVGANGVQSSDDITSTAPIQVQMVTGACGGEDLTIVSGHGFTLQPRGVWDTAYWAPVPGFGTAPKPNPEEGRTVVDTDIYLHNPDTVERIFVTVTSGSRAPVVLPIGPNATISVLRETGWDDLAEGNQGTYLSSEGAFWGVSVVDSASIQGANDDWDWGYSLVPESKLSSQLVVGYAPGTPVDRDGDGLPDDNGNLAFVVAVSDTTIYVDLDQDGWPDPFDMNGDGDYVDRGVWGVPEWDECKSALGVQVRAGQVLRVGDPFDRNLQGARIYTAGLGEHIAAAWGQDPSFAHYSQHLDLGYTLLPLLVPTLSKDDGLGAGDVYLPGDVVTYTIVVENNGMASMSDVVLEDTLPYTYTDLVGPAHVTTPPPTGEIRYYVGGQWQAAPAPRAERLRVRWLVIEPGQEVTITLPVLVHTAISATVDEICNQARVTSPNTDPIDAEKCRPVRRPLLSIVKDVDREVVNTGAEVTYTVVVSNGGGGLATPTVISDLLPSGVEYLPGTLNLTWPVAQVETVTDTKPYTNVFRGLYADDFDLGTDATTNYAGNDGSLEWTGDWYEVNDNDEPGSGVVQVVTNETNAFSAPAYVELGDPGGNEAGLARVLDLSQFVAPSLRYYPASSRDDDEFLSVTVYGESIAPRPYTGTLDYCVREVDLSDYAGQSNVVLGWLVTTGMEAGGFYRLDHISVHETQAMQMRIGEKEVPSEVTTYSYRTLSGQEPVSYDRISGRIVFTDALHLPEVHPFNTFTATFRARVNADPPVGETLWLTNTACVTSTHWLEILSPLCDDAPIRITQEADLAIGKSADPDPDVENGSILTYTLAYTNLGGESVQDATITDTLPGEVTYDTVVAQPPGWSAPTYIPGPPATLTWHTPTLAAGAAGQIVYTVIVDPVYTGPITNNVCISTTTPELRYDNNCDDQVNWVWPELVNVAVTKDDLPDPVAPGAELVYTLTYTNTSDYLAENVVVTDSLPAETTFVGAVPAPSSTGDPLTWEAGTLQGGEGGTIVVTVQVGPQVTEPFTNTACVSTTTREVDYDDNCDNEPTDVLVADVAIDKVDDPDPVGRNGRQVVYELVYTNLGAAEALSTTITDTLPPEVVWFRAAPAPSSRPSPRVLVWDVGTLAPRESGTIVVTTTLALSAGPAVNNRVVISTITPESNVDNNEDREPTDVILDLGIYKDHEPEPALRGEPVIYTLEYVHNGWFDAQDAYITDTLPVGLSYVRMLQQPPGWNGPRRGRDVDGQETLTWDRTTLAVGAWGEIVYEAVADEDTPPMVINKVCISNTLPDWELLNDCAEEPTAVRLLTFRARRLPQAILLHWETAWEVDSFEFLLLRSASGRLDDAQEIASLPARGRGGGGAVYGYLDHGPEGGLESGTAYSYWLIEVDTSGRRTTYGTTVSAAYIEYEHQSHLPFLVWR